jgi:hypothetical protein
MDALVPRSGQQYDRASGAQEAHTLLLLGILLVGGDGGACALRIRSLLDMECLRYYCIACRRALLRAACCFLIPLGCLPNDSQLKHAVWILSTPP